jgi:hypothetical protein
LARLKTCSSHPCSSQCACNGIGSIRSRSLAEKLNCGVLLKRVVVCWQLCWRNWCRIRSRWPMQDFFRVR